MFIFIFVAPFLDMFATSEALWPADGERRHRISIEGGARAAGHPPFRM